MTRARRRGVTVVEVLVVIGILGVLVGLLLPAVQQARGSADRAACADRLRQAAVALHNFHAAHGRFPPVLRPTIPDQPTAGDPNELVSWAALILPHIDQEALWRQTAVACALTAETYKNPPHVGYSTVLTIYQCPADGRLSQPVQGKIGSPAALGSWVGVAGSGRKPGVLPGGEGVRLTAVTDGATQTIMVGERPPPDTRESGRWYSSIYRYEPFRGPGSEMHVPEPPSPTLDERCAVARVPVFGPGRPDNPCDMYHFWSLHAGGANFAFADGSVRFLPYSARDIMPALATRSGGETVVLPD
jgi:prepilin-type processing-associated H-X9-DG protein